MFACEQSREAASLRKYSRDVLPVFANFVREWFQKYQQKQLDGSKNSLLSIVSSQLIVILLFWLSHFRVPFDEKVTKPSQLTQDESMDSAALAETKIVINCKATILDNEFFDLSSCFCRYL